MDIEAIIMANPYINVYNLSIGDVICLPCVPQNKYNDFKIYSGGRDTLGSIIERRG